MNEHNKFEEFDKALLAQIRAGRGTMRQLDTDASGLARLSLDSCQAGLAKPAGATTARDSAAPERVAEAGRYSPHGESMGGHLTERAKITLTWRPTGAPARRRDDFVEVAYVAQANEPEPPTATVDRSDITLRLENWGRWAKSADGPFAAACMTGAICESLRREAGGSAPSVDAGVRYIDSSDATLIGRVMVKVTFDQRRLLGLLYVDGARKGYIAALLRFHPQDFDKRLAEAQDALQAVLAAYQNSNST